MSIVHVDFKKRQVEKTPYDDFASARQAMLRLLQAWIETRPAGADIAEEIAGTVNAVTMIAALCTTEADHA